MTKPSDVRSARNLVMFKKPVNLKSGDDVTISYDSATGGVSGVTVVREDGAVEPVDYVVVRKEEAIDLENVEPGWSFPDNFYNYPGVVVVGDDDN